MFGRLLEAVGFKRLNGVLFLVVVVPDGSPGTIRADATDVFGKPGAEETVTVLSVEGIRALRVVVEALEREMPHRVRERK